MSRASTSRRPSSTTLLDAGLVAGLPVALGAVYLLPVSTRRSLALDYLRPDAVSVYASHFVHFEPGHLGANALGFGLAAAVGYLLATAAGERRRFRIAVVSVLVALPVVLSGLNLLWPRPRIGYGASGFVMGMAGLLPVFLFAYLDGVRGVDVSVRDAPALFFLGLAGAGVAAPLGPAGVGLGVAAVLAAGLYAADVGVPRRGLGDLPAGHPELLVAAVVLALGYPVVGFPSDPRVSGGVLNLYTHLLGYALAFIAAYLSPGVGIDVTAIAPTSADT